MKMSNAPLVRPAPARSSSAPGWQREPSLAELLSLGDARYFVPETIGLVVAIVMAQHWLLVGTSLPDGIPHPLWIPVLLIAVQYGIMGGLAAAIAATTAFLATDIMAPAATVDLYAYAGAVAARPCAWFAAALVIGGLRSLHRHHAGELAEQLRQMTSIAEDLGHGLEQASSEIDRLEQRIAGDSGTVLALLHSLAQLDAADRPSLIRGFADLIGMASGATSFVIFVREGSGLRPLAAVAGGALEPAGTVAPVPLASVGDGMPLAGATVVPFWTLVRGANETVEGAILCTRERPSQEAPALRRRLGDIGRLMFMLMDRCPRAAGK